MSARVWSRLGDARRLLILSARMIAGRKFWIAPLVPLLWIAFQILRLAIRWREVDYTPADAQNVLIGFPLTVLGIIFGMRIIAGEIDRRTLEIAYTVPGGTHRVWLAKLVAAFLLLVAAEALLALATFLFCTDYPLGALYGALQGAVVYMMLAMALSALFKSEAAGAMVTAALLTMNGILTNRFSPFWNPLAREDTDYDILLAWTTQNRIGFVIAICAIALLAFSRAENREKILSG
jgi:ABC-type transport system involved in multi-copper enzyme maturation permease subunit